MAKKEFEIDFLTNKDNYYLTENDSVKFDVCRQLELLDLSLYHIKEVSFEDQAPRKEALENVISAMKIDGINFIYLIMGDENGVHFYYGIAKNHAVKKEAELSVYDMGKEVLEPSIKGNFRGSKTVEVEAREKRDILDKISGMKYYSMLEGVPGYTKEDEKFQGVDRLADVMMGDRFGFMIIASPVDYDGIKEIEDNLYEVYSRIVPLAKKSMQSGESKNEGVAKSKSKGESATVGENRSKTTQESVNISNGTNEGKSKSHQKGTNSSISKSNQSGDSYDSETNSSSSGGSESDTTGNSSGTTHTEGKTKGGSESQGTSTSKSTNESASTQESTGTSTSVSTTLEYVDKKSQDWIKYFDDVIMPRLDYGMGKGIFITSSFLFTDSKAVLKKLENTAISLYSGENGNKVPLRAVSLTEKNDELEFLKNFQLPTGSFYERVSDHEPVSRSALSQYVKADKSFAIGNWITTNELAMIAGLPQKDVVGLSLREEVEFGLNYELEDGIKEEDKINLGQLVQSGNILENSTVCLDSRNLDKHVFVTGVTGSGKTTTCQNILCDSDIPFLVIEPAKTEYRILVDKYKDLLVFTLGNDMGTPFRLNPFEFFPHESISSRVDMIRASIEAAFDMEAAIPQIIESAIYACYEDCGWDIATNENSIYDDPFADGVYAFPTLEDLLKKTDVVVAEQGFDERLKNDYIGSIKARLMGLLVGAKGLMLNTKRSINFKDLLDKRVVLELEEIRSGAEKSLIMGFILTNLMEAIKENFLENGVHRHFTLVEEAHRLLSKFVPGDSPNKKHGVETFTDMLAEIRKYGESLMIADQIPNKLTPEILKNTNTKIVHRLFAEDDKNAIGNTIVLDQEQKEFLSNLETGRAIVFTQGFAKALQVQIKRETNTTSERQVTNEELQENVYRYYIKKYKTGIITGLQYMEKEPDKDDIKHALAYSKNKMASELVVKYQDKFTEILKDKNGQGMLADKVMMRFGTKMHDCLIENNGKRVERYADTLKKYIDLLGVKEVAAYLAYLHYNQAEKGRMVDNAFKEEKVTLISDFIQKYIGSGEWNMEDIRKLKNNL